MKPLLLLSLSLTAALGIPLSPQVKQSPVLKEGKESVEGNVSPILGDYVPAQGHVEEENPAPPPVLTPMKEQKPPPPEDQKLSENMVELKVKVKPELQRKKELKGAEEEEAGKEPKEKLEEGGIVELKLEVKPEAKGVEELETEAETNEEEAKIKSEKEHEFDSEPDLKVELEVKLDEASLMEPADVEMEEKSEAAAAEEAEKQSEDEEDFKVEAETKVELETHRKEEPEEKFLFAQEKFEVQQETAERHIDMERPQEGHPFVESQEDDDDDDDDDDTVLFEEQEDEKLQMKKNNHLDEQRVSEMELEAVLEEEPDVHQLFQQEPFSENSLPEQKRIVVQEPKRGFLEEEGETEHEFPVSALKNLQTGRRFCAGVAADSKCYQFFTGPRTFKDAEYFCLQQFTGGHLASITSQFIHRQVLKLILQQNGSYTRAWVGGYRLDRNHFIWVDGSLWSYADWLPGEPNHTSGVEDCLEVLGNIGSEPGKFNDFTCWTPQAFVCSYPHH